MTETYTKAAHPTEQKLIDAFLQMAEHDHFGKITVNELLRKTGVSKGSLYHHFENFDDLVGFAMAQAFSIGINRSIALLEKTLGFNNTREDLQLLFRRLTLDTLTPEGLRQRLVRAQIIGASAQYPKLRKYVGVTQAKLTSTFVEMFTRAERKGLLKPNLNLHVAAVFIQAYTFGKIIDDLGETTTDPDEWADWIVSVLTYKILA